MKYVKPTIVIIELETEDVITASRVSGGGNHEFGKGGDTNDVGDW